MKKMKKWISAILSIAMVAGLFGSPARNAQAIAPADVVSSSEYGWWFETENAMFAELLYGADDTGVFSDRNYTNDSSVIGDYISIGGLNRDAEVYVAEMGLAVYKENNSCYDYDVADIDGNSRIALYIDLRTKNSTEYVFKEATYLDTLFTVLTVIPDECSVGYNNEDYYSYARILVEFGTLDYLLYHADDIVSSNGWSLNVNYAALATLLDEAEDNYVFWNEEYQEYNYYTYEKEVFEKYVTVSGMDTSCLDGDYEIEILVYDEEEEGYTSSWRPLNDDSKIALGIGFWAAYHSPKNFQTDTFLSKLSSNAIIRLNDCEWNYDYVYLHSSVWIVLELGTIDDIKNHKDPAPDPDPDPTYVEWNTDDPNVTKLMWHGGKSTYATITETKDSTEVKFTGIGWFSIPDVLDAKFQESVKDTNVTYPYKGYTVSVKIPAGKVKRTGVAWYGPEYFPSLYMEEGYVTVTDYLGREVDPQVIITKKN